jgi:hypothetical protein
MNAARGAKISSKIRGPSEKLTVSYILIAKMLRVIGGNTDCSVKDAVNIFRVRRTHTQEVADGL